MSGKVTPTWCPRDEAVAIFIDALVLHHRSGWAAPGGFKQGRADHFRQCLQAYVKWHSHVLGRPTTTHLALVAEAMMDFKPPEGRVRTTVSPWVLDEDFPAVCAKARTCEEFGYDDG